MAPRVALATRSSEKADSYRTALRAVGLEPVDFTPGSLVSLDRVCGLVLTGGTDVDPELFGQPPHPETDPPDRERDKYETCLLRDALARDLPVLAICRGMQLFNVVCGGTLIQHLASVDKHRRNTEGVPIHDVALEGALAKIAGAAKVPVNSRHHQAVDRPGEGLIVTARDAEDGVIEGIEHTAARFAVGVQWHPENMSEDLHQKRLFEAFRDAVTAK